MRFLREDEKAFLTRLFQVTNKLNTNLDLLKVEDMKDGEMGSLYFVTPVKTISERRMGKCISGMQFTDNDNILVLVSLNVDEDDELFELDIWKTDFSPLIQLPKY